MPVSDVFTSPPISADDVDSVQDGVPPVEEAVNIYALPALMAAISLDSHVTPTSTEAAGPNMDDDAATESSGLPGFPGYRSSSLKQATRGTASTPAMPTPAPATAASTAPPFHVPEESWSPRTKGSTKSNKSVSSLYDTGESLFCLSA